jgi:hypothetical protein
LLIEFFQKSRIKIRVLSEEDKEDLVLGLMMQETDYNDTIDTNEFINNCKVNEHYSYKTFCKRC